MRVGAPKPALATITSVGPSRSSTSATAARSAGRSPTSPTAATAAPPAAGDLAGHRLQLVAATGNQPDAVAVGSEP